MPTRPSKFPDDCDVLVLAAGRGTRMGCPKAAMEVAGRPWCQHQIERLERVGVPALWVISSEAMGLCIARRGRGRAPQRIMTGDPGAPMFASLLAGISIVWQGQGRHASGGVFVLPVDVPAPSPKVWRSLAESACVSAPQYQGKRGHPVFLPWPWVECLVLDGPGRWQRMGLPGEPRLNALIENEVRLVDVDDSDVIVNLNTPEDVASWLAQRGNEERAA